MTLTQSLRDEHDAILRALRVLDAMARAARARHTVHTSDIFEFVAFCRSFIDGLHQRKEEDVLFPALQKAGLPRNAGPLGCMLREHDTARDMIGQLNRMAAAVATDDPDAVAAFVRIAEGYVALVTTHIEKENSVLYVMAEQFFGEAENRRLIEGVETLAMRSRRQRELERLAALEARWVAEPPRKLASA